MPTLLPHPAPRSSRRRTLITAALAALLGAAVPAAGSAPAPAAHTPMAGSITFYAGAYGEGAELLTLREGSPPTSAPPAGVRSARLRGVQAGTTFDVYVSAAMAKLVDPLHPGTVPGAGAWTRVTALRDVDDCVVGSFDLTYADRDVRVEHNGPGGVDGHVARVALNGVETDLYGLRFVHASDLHVDVTPASPGVCENCDGNRKLVAALNGLDTLPDPSGRRVGPVSFALLAGDVLDQPDAMQAERFAGIYRALRFPYHLVSGNHDLPRSHFYVDYLAPLIKEQHGGQYLYSFNQGGVHFVAQHTNCPDQCVKGQNWDAFRHSLDFLEEDLRHVGAGVPIVVFQHYGFDGYTIGANDWPAAYRERFLSIVRGRNLVGLLTGHSHVLETAAVPGLGADYNFISGSLDSRPGRGMDRQVWVYRVTRDSLLADALNWDNLTWSAGRHVRRALAADTFWSQPAAVPGTAEDVPTFADVGGTRWMVWSGADDRRIRVAKYDAAAGRWGSPSVVAAGNADAVSWGAVGAGALLGRLTLVWHKHGTSRMYVSSMDSFGGWSTPTPLPGMDIGNYKSPAVAVVGGALHVVFNGWGNTRLWHTATTMGNGFRTAEAIPGSDTDNQPALVDQGGMLAVVWTRHLGDRAIHHQQLQNGAWSAPFAVVHGTATSDRGPGLAWHQGRLFLTWSDAGRVYQATWKDHVWSPKLPLPVPGVVSHRGTSMGVAGGTLYVGWNAGGRTFYASRGL
ncbi:MAG: hypothetical protein JWM27_4631 [Gemmatimonadetes bacterium]|nr:hypothetical protein [Gemmatimonadota bacterium]